MTRALMFMGTGSDVGKSMLVAGLCRAFANRGLKVAPFKPQNMSNNAAVTADGGEIGRAQALQARASRLAPITAMNPVLLKPEQETGAQVIVRGKRVASMSARDYFKRRAEYMPEVLGAFHELATETDLVLVEGAGSASEINLRAADLANFGFARAANVPVVLVGDIQRGGVIAAIVGTFAVIAPEDADLVKASLINKFQGDPSLFSDGAAFIAETTRRPVLGPVPYFADARKLPAEDVLALDAPAEASVGHITIAVPRLPRIANFDDLDPLRSEPDVRLVMVNQGDPLPRDADIVVLPGSKATRSDLEALKSAGWDEDIRALYRLGTRIFGICGGYQMLGRTIADPDGVEGYPGTSEGLGLLDIDTIIEPQKQLRLETGTHVITGTPLSGYHMHMGVSRGPDISNPFAQLAGVSEGAQSADGRVTGTYLHGVFASDSFRRAFLHLDPSKGQSYESGVEQALDDLAAHLEHCVDLDQLLSLAGEVIE
ncbi:cobyric acid synthase [Devosia pacifica]|uniref:Cobyric acid synthase n=1 Tax=Devosia pacifica TaxID=1335967 RepID=A0A918SA73_9HYPH|nr:cobyric acid synthase [Devosia pacifica]GHA30787.1 cobyric acid synthase [Devosia pacifica]